jgi:hypothetical protein
MVAQDNHFTDPSPVVRGQIDFWYRDLISCLQSTFATVLGHRGHDPLEVLGAHWEFRFTPGKVHAEEFDYPCRFPDDLGRSLAPYHPVSSRWHRPSADEAPLAGLIAAAQRQELTIAAVDNYHLPFRPAYHDVHAAHLVVVYGVDASRGLIYLCDSMPPRFRGSIAIADFVNAWSSANQRSEEDEVFSGAGIDRRWLSVDLGEPFPVCDAAFLRRALADDREIWHVTAPPSGVPENDDWVGAPGLWQFLDALLESARGGDGAVLAEAYPFGWGPQAQASLHGELLRRWGRQHRSPVVAEAGGRVEAVAHAWTGLRMTAAHGRRTPIAAVTDLERHARILRGCYEAAVEALYEAEVAL